MTTPQPGVRPPDKPSSSLQAPAQPTTPWPAGVPRSAPPTGSAPAGRPGLGTTGSASASTFVSRYGPMVALGAALLALLVSCASALFSWRAADQAAEAKDAALGGRSQQGATPQAGVPNPTAAPAEKPPPADPNATVPPTLGEDTVYSVHYTKQTLTLTAKCNDSMYADLDEPRGNVASNGADIEFIAGCSATNPSGLSLGSGVDASSAGAPNMDPRECADRIRTSPVGDAPIPVRKGVAICMTTSYAAARARGDRWRLVLLVVTGVAEDGAVTVEANAWDAPG